MQFMTSIWRCLGAGFLLLVILIATSCEHDLAVPPGNTVSANLNDIQNEIFTKRCALSGCHVPGGGGPMALRNKDESFANLVGVRSIQRPSLNRVQPNDAGASYLIQKLENAAGILGGRMPLSGEPLNADQINAIRDWIEAGALNN